MFKFPFLVLVISALTFFRRIDAFPLRNWDEAWYGEIIKNMAYHNYNILVPFWNGRYYFDHAPLYFWTSFPIFKIFGPGEWQERIVSVISAIFISLLVYLVGAKLFNKRVGFFALLIFLTLGQVVIRFSHGNLDALIIFLFLATFYFYLKSDAKKIYAILSGICLGLGFLVKGWGIGLFPLFLLFVFKWNLAKKIPQNVFYILIFALFTCGWWYILGLFKFGGQFFNWYILNPSEGRLADPLGNFSLIYFQFLVRDIGFWLTGPILFLLKKQKFEKIEFKIIVSLLITSLIYIFSLNFLSDKSDWYNLPIYPLLAIALGAVFDKLFKRFRVLAILIFCLVLITQIFNVIRIENIYPDRSKVGAKLGLSARQVVPRDAKLILDDHDFTSFLYYSNHKEVFEISQTAKAGEWWILKQGDIPRFLDENRLVFIVTPNFERLNLKVEGKQIKAFQEGYYFVEFRKEN